jgi:hypothetical protein
MKDLDAINRRHRSQSCPKISDNFTTTADTQKIGGA